MKDAASGLHCALGGLVRRVARLEKTPPAFTPGTPPYLIPEATLSEIPSTARWIGEECGTGLRGAEGTITIDLPGATVILSADNPGALFDREYPDLETLLAAHRFAWLPLAGPDVDPGDLGIMDQKIRSRSYWMALACLYDCRARHKHRRFCKPVWFAG